MTTSSSLSSSLPSRYKPYPRYKDSGVEWLGRIPENWEVKRLKFLASIRFSGVDKHTVEGELPVRLCNYTDVYYNDQITDTIEFMNASASRDEVERFSLEPDDVLITKDSETWDDIAVAAHVPKKIDNVLCGYHLALVRRKSGEMSGKYLARGFAARGINDQFRVAATGITRFGIGNSDIGNVIFCEPSKSEQRVIAEFLDRETAKIDNLIARKERLIELLEEKRGALITHAVTRGLDPNAPLRDSGIEWLGQIPAHWHVRRIAMAVDKITNGYVGPTRDILVLEGVWYLQSLHIKMGGIDFEKKPYFVTQNWSDSHPKSILKADDLLIVQTGDIGQVAPVTPEFAGANCHALIILRMKRGLGSGAYLAQFLQSDSGQNALKNAQTGALHPHLECGHVREIRVALPPPDEQQHILRWVTDELVKHDGIVRTIHTAIDRLKEYRATLITAAVTGKIDVRNEVKAAA